MALLMFVVTGNTRLAATRACHGPHAEQRRSAGGRHLSRLGCRHGRLPGVPLVCSQDLLGHQDRLGGTGKGSKPQSSAEAVEPAVLFINRKHPVSLCGCLGGWGWGWGWGGGCCTRAIHYGQASAPSPSPSASAAAAACRRRFRALDCSMICLPLVPSLGQRQKPQRIKGHKDCAGAALPLVLDRLEVVLGRGRDLRARHGRLLKPLALALSVWHDPCVSDCRDPCHMCKRDDDGNVRRAIHGGHPLGHVAARGPHHVGNAARAFF